MLICLSTLSISAQSNDSVKISKPQIKNIYIGLKQLDHYKKQLKDCSKSLIEMHEIVKHSDSTLQKSLKELVKLNDLNEKLNNQITNAEIEKQRLKSKKTPWYRHPITYAIIGFAGGVYLMK